MGLDSVELIVSFENYFDVVIADKEAENIVTVQDAVNCIARLLNISNKDESLKQSLFEKLKSKLIELKLTNETLSLNDTIFTRLQPENKETWEAVEQHLNLKMDVPSIPKKNLLERTLNYKFFEPNYNWLSITADQFITATIALNHEIFVQKGNIKCIYEILVVVIGITADKNGLDIYEVQPDKGFVQDLGIS